MLTFEYPWLFLALLAPPVVRWLSRAHQAPRAFLTVPFLAELSVITGRVPDSGASVVRGSFWQRLVLAMVWGLLVTALARPQWIAEPLIRILPARDMLIAVDLSASMENRDFTDASGHQVDRVTAVKEVMDDFLSRRDGDRIGLLFFGTAPFIQVPFTDDLNVSRVLLREAQARMAGPQTMLGDAVGKAISVFANSDVKEKVLIILADGNDSGSLVSPLKAAEIARNKGIRIHTIGMGDPATLGEERLDVETLKAMAEITGGEMFLAINREELEAVYDRIDAITTRQVETITHRPITDLYFLPLAAALLMVLLFHGARLWLTRPAAANETDQPQAPVKEESSRAGVM